MESKNGGDNMIDRYTIAGELAKFSEIKPEPHCNTCKNGDIFDEPSFKINTYGPTYATPICAVCNFKYNIPRFDCVGMTKKGQQIFKEYIENNWEELKMTPEIIKLREQYAKDKKCPDHKYKPAQPFTTSLGTFVIRSCPVCMVGQVEHKGQTYQAPVMELANWIAHESIVHTKNQAVVDSKVFDLGLNTIDTKPILAEPMPNLFSAPKQEIELPNLF